MTGSKLLFLLPIWALAMVSADSAIFASAMNIKLPLSRWHIHTVNGLGGSQVWTVHCKSKDDDLGEHNLTVGAEFAWTFKENYWGTTLFWCNTCVADRPRRRADFKAFWSDSLTLDSSCKGNCFWIAKDDGVYLKNITADKDMLMYKWERLA